MLSAREVAAAEAGASAWSTGWCSRAEALEVNGLFEHGEGREGITAFLEKRAPKFGV